MLTGGAISIGRTGNTAVILDPAAALGPARAIAVAVTLDANHPIRSTQLPPNGAARCALLKRARVIARIARLVGRCRAVTGRS